MPDGSRLYKLMSPEEMDALEGEWKPRKGDKWLM